MEGSPRGYAGPSLALLTLLIFSGFCLLFHALLGVANRCPSQYELSHRALAWARFVASAPPATCYFAIFGTTRTYLATDMMGTPTEGHNVTITCDTGV
mmetsp:Transcript_25820/g.78510  ORF Transcript_25820/g.78510 Transcript_25820/m.78510 type:complete len:98 (-) Transcript_25820:2172-2465(-)